MNRFEFIRDLGEGTSGQVSLYREKLSGNFVAIKQIFKNVHKSISSSREIFSLNLMSGNPYIVKLLETFEDSHTKYLVLEYCEDKNLREYFETRKFCKAYKSYICDILRSIKYCHESGIIHRDLKLENFLVNKGIVKLGDFGSSRLIENQTILSMCGTPINMAPEMFTSTNYTSKVDIWALGCIVYEIITKTHPFEAKNFSELEYKHKQKLNVKCFNEEEAEFIKLCLKKDHSKRACIDSLIHSRFIQSYLNKLLKNIEDVFDYLVGFCDEISNYTCFGISIYLITDNIYFDHNTKYRDYSIKFLSSSEHSQLDKFLIDKCKTSCLLMSKVINGFRAKYSSILLYIFRRLENIEDITLNVNFLGNN